MDYPSRKRKYSTKAAAQKKARKNQKVVKNRSGWSLKNKVKMKANEFYCVQCRTRKTRAKQNIFRRTVASPRRANGEAVQLISDCNNCKHVVQKFTKVSIASKYPQY